MTVAVREFSAQKIAVVDAARTLPWRWNSFDEICREAQPRHYPLPRRIAKLRLRGLEEDGWVEHSDALLMYTRRYRTWRWRLGATQDAARAAQAAGATPAKAQSA